MTYPFLLIFALAPSLVWLAFYLRKDSHPEPNQMIIKIFLGGMIVALLAIFIEHALGGFFSSLSFPPLISLIISFFFVIALIEELFKYAVVRFGVFSNTALDEPLDVMLYMIISALGFAAFENILLLFKLIQTYPLSDVFLVNAIRFMEAIFLHALVSGLFGYFIALSLLKKNGAPWLFFIGLGTATLLHGLFNFYIFTLGDKGLVQLLFPIIPLLFLAVFVSFAFQRLKLKNI